MNEERNESGDRRARIRDDRNSMVVMKRTREGCCITVEVVTDNCSGPRKRVLTSGTERNETSVLGTYRSDVILYTGLLMDE